MAPITRIKISRSIWKDKAKERSIENQNLRKKLSAIKENLELILAEKKDFEAKALAAKMDLEELKSEPKKK